MSAMDLNFIDPKVKAHTEEEKMEEEEEEEEMEIHFPDISLFFCLTLLVLLRP